MRRVCAELASLSRVFQECEVPNITPVSLKCDNQASIYITSNPIFHEHTKHIKPDSHYVREQVQVGLIDLSYVSTHEQRANILTKNLQGLKHSDAVSKLGVCSCLAT